MSEPENFVVRWSRLKRQSDREAVPEADAKHDAPAAGHKLGAEDEPADASAVKPPAPAFDPASLPPIESITAETDIRAFLQSGVPAELTRAALRRVWTTDPAIRDFIGIAENQWDFTDPTAMPGFGPLEPTDDVRKLVAQAMGKLGRSAEDLAGEAGSGDRQAAASSVQRSAASAVSPDPATGIQASGIPAGNPNEARGEEPHGEQDQVSGAAHHAAAPAERMLPSNRRLHGRALPK
jgi:hypothetical protein